MKTKLFTLLMILIIIGIVIPTFAISPDKDKGEKSKSEIIITETKTVNCSPSDLPLAPWTATVYIADTVGTCAAQGCALRLLVFPSNESCVAQSANPITYADYSQGTFNYYMTIPGNVPCVIIKIVDVPLGSCNAPFNKNECCICIGNPSCTLRICN